VGSGQGSAEPDQHRVTFAQAQFAFADPRRIIAADLARSGSEPRHYCFGAAGGGIMTVRFTFRGGVTRNIGAGYWRKGKRIYEKAHQIQR
jgi:hypothetical protein